MIKAGSWVLGAGEWMTVLSVDGDRAFCAGRDGGRRFFRHYRIEALTVHGEVGEQALAELRVEHDRG